MFIVAFLLSVNIVIAMTQYRNACGTAEKDLDAALAAKQVLIKNHGFKERCVSDKLLEDFLRSRNGDPAVDAILGGVLAQDVVRSLSRRGKPICNFFCFSTVDGAGWTLPIAIK